MNKIHRKLVVQPQAPKNTHFKFKTQRQSQPLQNAVISQVLQKMDREDEHQSQKRNSALERYKQKSEKLIQQTKMYIDNISRYKRSTELTSETAPGSSVFTSKVSNKKAEKLYEVKPPEIIQKPQIISRPQKPIFNFQSVKNIQPVSRSLEGRAHTSADNAYRAHASTGNVKQPRSGFLSSKNSRSNHLKMDLNKYMHQQFKQQQREPNETDCDSTTNDVEPIFNLRVDLYQPISDTRNWMIKRGKENLLYYNRNQIGRMKAFFDQMDVHNIGYIGISELEEILISLGLTNTKKEILDITTKVLRRSPGPNPRINFETFLLILKEAQVRNKRGIRGNYLTTRNIHFEDATSFKKEDEPKKASLDQQQRIRQHGMRPNHGSMPKIRHSRSFELRRNQTTPAQANDVDDVEPLPETNPMLITSYGQKHGFAELPQPEESQSKESVYKNSRPQIQKFFQNLSATGCEKDLKKDFGAKIGEDKTKEKQACPDLKVEGQIPFKLLVGNFRRKMILETIKDPKTNQDEKNEILNPYHNYLKAQREQIVANNKPNAKQFYTELSSSSSEAEEEAYLQPKCEKVREFIVAKQLEEELKKQIKSIKKRRHLKDVKPSKTRKSAPKTSHGLRQSKKCLKREQKKINEDLIHQVGGVEDTLDMTLTDDSVEAQERVKPVPGFAFYHSRNPHEVETLKFLQVAELRQNKSQLDKSQQPQSSDDMDQETERTRKSQLDLRSQNTYQRQLGPAAFRQYSNPESPANARDFIEDRSGAGSADFVDGDAPMHPEQLLNITENDTYAPALQTSKIKKTKTMKMYEYIDDPSCTFVPQKNEN